MQTETTERAEMPDHGMVAIGLGGVRPAEEGEREKIDSLAAEMKERAQRSIEDADAAGAYRIMTDLEGPTTRIARAATTLRLIAATGGIEDNVSDAIHLLADMLETDIETVESEIEQAHDKLRAFGRGYMKAMAVEKSDEDVVFTADALNRLQGFVDEHRPPQIKEVGVEFDA